MKSSSIPGGVSDPPTTKAGELARDQLIAYNQRNADTFLSYFNSSDLKVQTQQLTVGDILISDTIAIERKAKKDFVNSILDKRLFPQLIDLAKNFKRPVLIIEGEENIYSIRNANNFNSHIC